MNLQAQGGYSSVQHTEALQQLMADPACLVVTHHKPWHHHGCLVPALGLGLGV